MEIGEKMILTVPVYRCSEEKYQNESLEKRKNLEKHYNQFSANNNNYWIQEIVDSTQNLNHRPWKYNEIVGFLEIFISGMQIRCESYFIKKSEIRKGIKNKTFRFNGKEFEISVKYSMSNATISDLLIEQFKNLELSKQFAKRYFDLEIINNVSSCINWKVFFR